MQICTWKKLQAGRKNKVKKYTMCVCVCERMSVGVWGNDERCNVLYCTAMECGGAYLNLK